MEAVNGVSELDKGGPPAPSPLTGCYLLIVVGEPHSKENKDIILRRIAKGLLSWDSSSCYVDLEKELAIISEQAPEGEDARYGERLIQFASENLVTEVLIHPAISTLSQCMKNLLSSFTRHRHIIHAGYTFAGNGSWILQDGTLSLTDFSEAFQEIEVQRVLRAYDNTISLDIHCSPEGDWGRLPKESFTKNCKVRLNPNDVLTSGSPAIVNFLNYISPFLIPTDIEMLLESSDVVGNIRFSHPTLYVFPGGQGDAALFGINGFNMLVDGGFGRKACFWDFVRHLDRLDAVLLTRLNNSNVNGISSVLRRKRHNTVYPHIGHFFCNIQERKAILSPDGDKDKDPLLINLFEEGQGIINNLRQLNLQPQPCYREVVPMNLYHKVGHGTLDMYILSPSRDSKEVKEFLQKWNSNDHRLFSTQKNGKEFVFPTYNLVSICALLVWQPANMSDNITRILFPGSSPQHKIFEGLDKLKQLECIKYASCSAKTLTSTIIKSKLTKTERILQDQKELKPKSMPDSKAKIENKVVDEELKNGHTNGTAHPIIEKAIKKYDSTESDKSGPQIIETKKDLVNGKTVEEKTDKLKTKSKPESKVKAEIKSYKSARPMERKTKPPIPAEKKASPTTPKKTVEAKMNGDATKLKPAPKTSPSATPAKSAKDANNRKVVESKIKSAPKREPPKPTDKKEAKPERKPISRRPKGTSPVGKMPESPIKKITELHKLETRKPKLEKECTTDSSTVSTPSADVESTTKKDLSKLSLEEIEQLKAKELAELKEEQDVVKEIEAVFRKSETKETEDLDMRKVKNISIDEKTEGEGEEYLIIEKEEMDHDSLDDKDAKESETQKHLRDSEESEKQRKLSDVIELVDVKEKQVEDEETAVVQEPEVVPITHAREEKERPKAIYKEVSVTSPDEKIEESSRKKITDREIEEEIKDINILESQPDEKFSTPIESGATTAPTLPEDERIPLDEIKEDNVDLGIEEKYVKEDTKEKEMPVVQFPPKAVDSIAKIPSVVGIRLDKQTPMRDIVKTPDEVADLPVHEEVDIENYEQYQAHQAQTPKGELKLPPTKVKSEEIDIPDNEQVKVEISEKGDEEKRSGQKTPVVEDKLPEKPAIPEELHIPALVEQKQPEGETIRPDQVLSESKRDSVEKVDAEKVVTSKESDVDEEKLEGEDELKKIEAEIIDTDKIATKHTEKAKDIPEEVVIKKDTEAVEQVVTPKEDESSFESRRVEVLTEVKVEKISSTKSDKPFAKEAAEEDEKEKDTMEDLKTDVEQVEEIQLAENIKLVEAQELINEVKNNILESELLSFMEKDIKATVTDAFRSAQETVAAVCKAMEDEVEQTFAVDEPEPEVKKDEELRSQNVGEIVEPEDTPVIADSESGNKKDAILPIETTGEVKRNSEVEEFADKILEDRHDILKKLEIAEENLVGELLGSKSEVETKDDEMKQYTVEIELQSEGKEHIEADEEDKEEVGTDHDIVIRTVREDSLKLSEIDKKLQELKESVESDPKPLSKEPSLMIAELDMVDKLELGRKSPKEREQDVAKIVASVAEVLKSDAPLEEFEGKIPLDVGTFSTISPYATELRETHITTLESPIRDIVVESLTMDPIEEEKFVPSDPTAIFIHEEKKIAAIHTDYDTLLASKEPSRVSSLLKDSNDLIQATSKIISDIKLTTKTDDTIEVEDQEIGFHKSPVSGKTSPNIEKAVESKQHVEDWPAEEMKLEGQYRIAHDVAKEPEKKQEPEREGLTELKEKIIEEKTQVKPEDKKTEVDDKDAKELTAEPLGIDIKVIEEDKKKSVEEKEPKEPREKDTVQQKIEKEKLALDEDHAEDQSVTIDEKSSAKGYENKEAVEVVKVTEDDREEEKETVDLQKDTAGEDKVTVIAKLEEGVSEGKKIDLNDERLEVVDKVTAEDVATKEKLVAEEKSLAKEKPVTDEKPIEEDKPVVEGKLVKQVKHVIDDIEMAANDFTGVIDKTVATETVIHTEDNINTEEKASVAEIIEEIISETVGADKIGISEKETHGEDTLTKTEIDGKEMLNEVGNREGLVREKIIGEVELEPSVDEKHLFEEKKTTKAEDQEDIQKKAAKLEEKVVHVEATSIDEKHALEEKPAKEEKVTHVEALSVDGKHVFEEEKTNKAEDQEDIQKKAAEDMVEQKVIHVETPSVKLKDEHKEVIIEEKPTKSEDQEGLQSKVTEDVTQEKVVHVEVTSMDEKHALEEKPAKEEIVSHVEAPGVIEKLALEESVLDEGGVQRKTTDEEITRAEIIAMVKEKAEIKKQEEKTKEEGDVAVLEKEIYEKTLTADIKEPTKSETEVVERKTSFSLSADMPISERFLEDPLTKDTHAEAVSEHKESQPPELEGVHSSNAELKKVKMSIESGEIFSVEKVPHDENKELQDAAQPPECADVIKSVTEELDKVKAPVGDSELLPVEEKLSSKVDALVNLKTRIEDLKQVVDESEIVTTDPKKITPSLSPDLKCIETALPHSDIISSPQLREEKGEIVAQSPTTSISDAKEDSSHLSGKSSPTSVVEHIDDIDKLERKGKDSEIIVIDQKDVSPIISRTISPDFKTESIKKRDSTTTDKISLEHDLPSEGKQDKMSSNVTKKEETSHDTLGKEDISDDRVSGKLEDKDLAKVDTYSGGIGFMVDEHISKQDTVIPSDVSTPGLATDVSAKKDLLQEEIEFGKPLPDEIADKNKVEGKSQDSSLAHTVQEETEVVSEKVSVLPISSEVSLRSQNAEVKHETEEVELKELAEQSTNQKSQIFGEKTIRDISTEIVFKESPEECAKLVKSSEILLQDLKSEIPAELDERLTENSTDRPSLEMEDVTIKGKSQTSSGKVSPEITVKEILAVDKDKSPSGSGKSTPVIMLEGKDAPVPVIDKLTQRSDTTYETGISGRSSPEVVELTKDLLGTKQSPIISRKSTPEIIVDNEFVVLDRLSSSDVDIIETEKTDAESGDKTIHITESVSEVPKSSVDNKDATQVPGVPEKVPTEDKEVIVSISQSSDSAEPSLSIVSEASTSAETKVEILDATEVKDVDLSSGRTTPPTAPVSPLLKEQSTYSHDKPVEKKETVAPVTKGVNIRTATPGSDDCDISSGQVSRVLTTEEDDYKQVYSDDEEIPGSPLSATSQIAHSISSQYDFEDSVRGAVAMDPMSTSLYGALPDDPEGLHQEAEQAGLEESANVVPHGSPSHIYEITTAKFANIHLQEELKKQTKPDPKADIMTASFIGSELPSDSKEDLIASWGKPLGLPSPAPLNDNKGTPKKEKKVLTNVMFKNRINEDKKTKKVNPVYVDLTYVPHNGNSNYSYLDFFKRVRARYYVFSGIEPSKEVYSALLEAKQTWDDKDLEVTIIPTYDTDVLGYWVAENEDLLAKYKIDLSPSASRCTINLQDHETSCSAYRLEFS